VPECEQHAILDADGLAQRSLEHEAVTAFVAAFEQSGDDLGPRMDPQREVAVEDGQTRGDQYLPAQFRYWDVEFRNTTVEDHQGIGVLVDGSASTVDLQSSILDDSAFAGNPDLAFEAVQISRGATGEVEDNLIEHNETGGTQAGWSLGVYVDGGATDTSTGGPLDLGVRIVGNTLLDNDEGVNVYEADDTSGGADPTATPVYEQVLNNRIVKDDGVTNHTPYGDQYGNTYAGYQTGIVDESNSDTIADNGCSRATERLDRT
jgi:hypothetical protein